MVLQPHSRNLPWFGLVRVRSPLLTESRLISFPPGTEMFQFPGLAPLRVLQHYLQWVSPFGHSRIVACLPAPRDFSQAPTSFIASYCQGIHHVPFVALFSHQSLDRIPYLSICSERVSTFEDRHFDYHHSYSQFERTVFRGAADAFASATF